MKCDSNRFACRPCSDKNLPCYSTDRVTGEARERGQVDRSQAEIQSLKEELQRYKTQLDHFFGGHSDHVDSNLTPSSVESPASRQDTDKSVVLPSPEYIGWPAPDHVQAIYPTPIDGMMVDVLDWGNVDLSTSNCGLMRESEPEDKDAFNFSQKAVLRSIFKRQSVQAPNLPDREAAMEHTKNFFAVLWGFVPIVHKKHFKHLVELMYDSPEDLSMPQRVQVLVMLAIMAHQDGIRNHQLLNRKMEQAYSCFHAALYNYSELAALETMEAMQALAMLLVLFRNMPKPGFTWRFAQLVLSRAIELNYHRNPERIRLPVDQQNPLAHELRKRVFLSILSICVTTGCRIGRPSPSQYGHWDVPLPRILLDDEISEEGVVSQLSGRCDYRPCIQLVRLLPLFTELFDYVLSTRRPGEEYLKIVDILQSKIDKWRQEWTVVTANDVKNGYYDVVTCLIHSWHAEFRLYLYHPSVCTSTLPHAQVKTQRACLQAARDLLATAQKLIHIKSADFTWHSMVAYALGCGFYAHWFRKYTGYLSDDDHKKICNDFAGWRSLMYYADLVMCTDNFMKSIFDPVLRQVVLELNSKRDRDTSRRAMNNDDGVATSDPSSNAVTLQWNSPAPERRFSLYDQATPQHHLPSTAAPRSRQSPEKSSTSPVAGGVHPANGLGSIESMTQPNSTNVPYSLGTILNGVGQYNMYQPAVSMSTVSALEDREFVFTPQFYTEPGEQEMWPQIHHSRRAPHTDS